MLTIDAAAKINLYLKIIRRLDDGYHEIETVFERISIFDQLSVDFSKEPTLITCDNVSVPTDKNSLLGRVVSEFNGCCEEERHFRITLKKNIPVGAGMGGGSSDAAALLKGLNRICDHPLGDDKLLDIGRGLGADIPFFLNDCSFGFGSGRGDIIKRFEETPEIWHVVVNPPFEVSTKETYEKVSALVLTKDDAVDKMFSVFLSENNISGLSEKLHNDLQAIVLQEFPVLEKVFSELMDSGAKGALLSGSGPTVFGIFDGDEAENAGDRLRKIFPEEKNWKVFVTKTCK